MKTVKKIIIGGVGLAAVLGAGFLALTHHGEIAPQQSIAVQDFSAQQISWGLYLL